MGTGLSPQQRTLLEMIRERTAAGKVTTMSHLTRVLYPDGYELTWRPSTGKGAGTWAIPINLHKSLLRSLHRLQKRGLVNCSGRASTGELRWWSA
jgi:hypothetical protein